MFAVKFGLRFRRPLRRCVRNAGAHNRRCWARALSGTDLRSGALADCNEALRLAPNTADVLNSRGLVQLKLGAFPQAISDYSAVIAQDTNDADSLYGRGNFRGVIITGDEADRASLANVHLSVGDVICRVGVSSGRRPSEVQTHIDQLKSESKKAALLLALRRRRRSPALWG
jgi:tetratricopeptide (TPR) repeat protein